MPCTVCPITARHTFVVHHRPTENDWTIYMSSWHLYVTVCMHVCECVCVCVCECADVIKSTFHAFWADRVRCVVWYGSEFVTSQPIQCRYTIICYNYATKRRPLTNPTSNETWAIFESIVWARKFETEQAVEWEHWFLCSKVNCMLRSNFRKFSSGDNMISR